MSYFNKEQIIDLSKIIINSDKYYAHMNGEDKENLTSHIDLCNSYFLKLTHYKGVGESFLEIEGMYLKDFSEDTKKLFRSLIINTINFHDVGKINPIFQILKMKNKNKFYYEKEFTDIKSNHSIISSVLYIDYFYKKIMSLDKKERSILLNFLYINSFIISKHHSNLDIFEGFRNKFDEYGEIEKVIALFKDEKKKIYNKELDIERGSLYKKFKNVNKRLLNLTKEESIGIYIYTKLLYSLLVASDFYSTSEFMSNTKINDFGEIKDINSFYNIYKNTSLYQNIRKYEEEREINKDLSLENNINILRTEMFLEAEGNLNKFNDKKSNIYFLEAPTGSGKSNVALNLSFNIISKDNRLKKIYYVYPFNTLVEQNLKSLEKIFGKYDNVMNNIAVINSITPIRKESTLFDDDLTYDDYSKILLNRQFLNYPIILTTHVSIFSNMFSANKESLFPFHQLANSVIVLDEIQSYKITIWNEIIHFLNVFSKILNIKVIIMSATLPDLGFLLDSNKDENILSLITDRKKYFNNKLFKDRVRVNYDLLESDINTVYNHLKKNGFSNKKILIEFIRKQRAYDFYRLLKEDTEIISKVELISGDDNSAERDRILKSIDNYKNGIILVATQVIEAGVDIDMDIGYKDISKLDSDEQFMGRINRSCKKDGIVYFFNVDDEKRIYCNDYRTNPELTLKDNDIKEILITKRFNKYYQRILEKIKSDNSKGNLDNIENFFKEKVGLLNFKDVEEKMKLINDDDITKSIFLSREIRLGNGKKVNGEEVWERYKNLLTNKNMEYAEREVKLSEARADLNYFIYQVRNFNNSFNDQIGELYKIDDGDLYFKDGKIDKEKITTGIGDFI